MYFTDQFDDFFCLYLWDSWWTRYKHKTLESSLNCFSRGLILFKEEFDLAIEMKLLGESLLSFQQKEMCSEWVGAGPQRIWHSQDDSHVPCAYFAVEVNITPVVALHLLCRTGREEGKICAMGKCGKALESLTSEAWLASVLQLSWALTIKEVFEFCWIVALCFEVIVYWTFKASYPAGCDLNNWMRPPNRKQVVGSRARSSWSPNLGLWALGSLTNLLREQSYLATNTRPRPRARVPWNLASLMSLSWP